MFPTGTTAPGSAAAAAVSTGPRFGCPAQPLQADLPGPEQSIDSHGDREILVRTRRRCRLFLSKFMSRQIVLPRITGGLGTWLDD